MSIVLAVVNSCYNLQISEDPKSFGVDVDELHLPAYSSTCSINVSCGEKWDISSTPTWMRITSIRSLEGHLFEWIVEFSVDANNDYNRDGTILFQTNAQTIPVSVSQEGTKGEYVPIQSLSLDKTQLDLSINDVYSLTLTILPSNASWKNILWESSNESVAKVFVMSPSSTYASVVAVGMGESVITVQVDDKIASCRVIVSKFAPKAIDLGLSVKWASCNLGATTPEETGDYYAWGEIIPYYSSLNPLVWQSGREGGYFWTSYKWCRGSYNTLTKYCSDPSYGYNGFTDYKTTLDPEDDAAFAQLGNKWRIPTISEIEELLNKCSWVWTLVNGIKGYRVTGTNGNSIFLPASGFWYEKLLDDVGVSGLYWSSSVYNGVGRYSLEFYPEYKGSRGFGFYYGHQIRPVYDD